jgi:hypothetical protein
LNTCRDSLTKGRIQPPNVYSLYPTPDGQAKQADGSDENASLRNKATNGNGDAAYIRSTGAKRDTTAGPNDHLYG